MPGSRTAENWHYDLTAGKRAKAARRSPGHLAADGRHHQPPIRGESMTTAALQPPFAYFGGKSTLASRIVDLLPPHEHYMEPFCGGSSVLLAKAPSTMETVNDLDGRLMTFWRC